ncbi:MAG: SUMF1/EgtB/PvdO family nonheme iron enzyme [Pseudomonadota bacterium]
MDVHDIADSLDFRRVISAEIRDAAAIIVVVGEGWAELTAPDGRARLSLPDDAVRFEIREALSQGLPIFPVLVGKGEMPAPADLPPDIRDFASRSARRLPNDDLYEAAVDRLLANVADHAFPNRAKRRLKAGAIAAALVAVASLGAFVALQVSPQEAPASVPPPGEPQSIAEAPEAENETAIALLEPPAAEPTQATTPSKTDGVVLTTCSTCPEMVLIPAGRFEMGVEFGPSDQKPKIERVLRSPFALGRYEVTEREWRACEADGVCAPRTAGASDAPVAGVTWRDATNFVRWLSKKSGLPFRLPTEIEWEYAAVTGEAELVEARYGDADGPFPTRSGIGDKAGLFDMIGNVWEWTAGCAHPYDAAAFPSPPSPDETCLRVLRGGGWTSDPAAAKARNRYARNENDVVSDAGLRVARDLTAEEARLLITE